MASSVVLFVAVVPGGTQFAVLVCTASSGSSVRKAR